MCTHTGIHVFFESNYRVCHKNITQYHCSNARWGIITVLLYPITYFQMAPYSAVHQREKSARWGRQNKPGDGSILRVLLAGQEGWSSGVRPSRHESCLRWWTEKSREDRTERKQETGMGTRREKKGEHRESRSPCSQSWRWDLGMAKSGSIRLVHVTKLAPSRLLVLRGRETWLGLCPASSHTQPTSKYI